MAVTAAGDEPVLVWVDLEMTGLDPARHAVLQFALAITGPVPPDAPPVHDWVLAATPAELAEMDEFVTNMHRRTGLLDRVASSGMSAAEVEEEALQVLSAACPPGRGILAGNSVWVDRTFLRHYFPRFEAYLHYRQVDVSSFKVMAPAWFGERGVMPKPEVHQAAADLHASMRELNFYRSLFGAGAVSPR